ncbi:hypothetical protein [Pseudonocardia abyssalis]|nr:hypothetical protein [Pseudonocardia abyssalis]
MGDDEERPEPGSMRFQDGSTTPREPTLAERRAREQAQRRQEAAARQAAEDEERGQKKRKRILVGAGVTVGVVALIAVGYAVARPTEEVQAQCVDEDSGEIVDDSNCVTPVADNGYRSGGGLYPIFIGGGGRQYHYNYGGSGTVGQRVSGGTTVVPSGGTRVTTSSGRDVSPRASSSGSDSVSRGGLGVSGGSSSSGS